MTIDLSEDRRPLGNVTWLALFRDGTVLYEFGSADEAGNLPPQVSFDRVAERADVAEVHLVPFLPDTRRGYVKIVVQPGERVVKKWVRTHIMLSDDPTVRNELPIIDAFSLISEKKVNFYWYASNDMMIITTHDEPPFE